MTPVPLNGSSMFPFLRSGDELLVDMFDSPRSLSTEDQVGEIFLYRCPSGEWVCHRYVGQAQNNFLLKGDWTYQIEAYKNLEVWGKVQGKVKDGKHQVFRKFLALPLFCYLQKQMRFSQVRGIRVLSRAGVFLLGTINRFWRS